MGIHHLGMYASVCPSGKSEWYGRTENSSHSVLHYILHRASRRLGLRAMELCSAIGELQKVPHILLFTAVKYDCRHLIEFGGELQEPRYCHAAPQQHYRTQNTAEPDIGGGEAM